jgi:hypothetical protein
MHSPVVTQHSFVKVQILRTNELVQRIGLATYLLGASWEPTQLCLPVRVLLSSSSGLQMQILDSLHSLFAAIRMCNDFSKHTPTLPTSLHIQHGAIREEEDHVLEERPEVAFNAAKFTVTSCDAGSSAHTLLRPQDPDHRSHQSRTEC